MTPSAEPASTRIEVAAYLMPANLLQQGEIVILVLKPSPWFVLWASLPVLAGAFVVGGLASALGAYQSWMPSATLVSLCLAMTLARMVLACWQWLGRTYVLTNLRIVTVRGLVDVRWVAAALSEVKQTRLTAVGFERMVGTGSIDCLTAPAGAAMVTWQTIARPGEIHQIVQEAVARARRPK